MAEPTQARPKGTLDFVPPDAERKHHVESVFRILARRYAFQEIVTPVFEHTEVFVKSSGAASDVVTKEMYSFQDRAGRDLTLRPEGTPGVVRAVLENRVRLPARLYYIGPYFRYGRPQKGRYREFNQLGLEALGEATPMTDAELIYFGDEFFRDLGIVDLTTRLNSIGCRECRPAYRAELVGFLEQHRDKLCDDCRVRLERNPLRVFDCKNATCHRVVGDAPKPRAFLCADCGRHFEGVTTALERLGLKYELDDRLVRGLDYYNRTTFEYVSGRLGAQDSLGGGGRYDYLVAGFGGPETPATGLAIGLERTMLAMPDPGKPARRRLAFVVWMTEAERAAAWDLVDRLRAEGIPTLMDYDADRPKRQFKSADAAGAACCVIIGPDELAHGMYSVKDLASGEQSRVPHDLIVPQVRAMLRD